MRVKAATELLVQERHKSSLMQAQFNEYARRNPGVPSFSTNIKCIRNPLVENLRAFGGKSEGGPSIVPKKWFSLRRHRGITRDAVD